MMDKDGLKVTFRVRGSGTVEEAEAAYVEVMNYLGDSPGGDLLREAYESDEFNIVVEVILDGGYGSDLESGRNSDGSITWNARLGLRYVDGNGRTQEISPAVGLAHEVAHEWLHQKMPKDHMNDDAQRGLPTMEMLKYRLDKVKNNKNDEMYIINMIETPTAIHVKEIPSDGGRTEYTGTPVLWDTPTRKGRR